jgi:xylose isomerase
MVLGKRMEDHLRIRGGLLAQLLLAGGDPFGGQTFQRPWFTDDMAGARMKADVAFEMIRHPGRAFLLLHDRGHRAQRSEPGASNPNVREIAEVFARRWRRRRRGSAGDGDLFSNRRYIGGRAATKPDLMSLPMRPRR